MKRIISVHFRKSKLGLEHSYNRVKSILIIRCDNCGDIFEKEQSLIAPARRSNTYFHVCQKCDAKRFAQRKGVERRVIWNRLASSTDDISKL